MRSARTQPIILPPKLENPLGNAQTKCQQKKRPTLMVKSIGRNYINYEDCRNLKLNGIQMECARWRIPSDL